MSWLAIVSCENQTKEEVSGGRGGGTCEMEGLEVGVRVCVRPGISLSWPWFWHWVCISLLSLCILTYKMFNGLGMSYLKDNTSPHESM